MATVKRGRSEGGTPSINIDTMKRPATLSSLPRELLIKIALHLDKASALAYARVCPATRLPAEHRIWRELDISLNPAFGEYPLVQPYARGKKSHLNWAKEEAWAAEIRHRTAVRERVKHIINRADERKWGLAEEVRIVVRPEANPIIVQLLEFVSSNLQSLSIASPPQHVFARFWPAEKYQLFDVKIMDLPWKFESLSYLQLGKGAIRYNWALPLITNLAPNLVSLDIHLVSMLDDPLDPDCELYPYHMGFTGQLETDTKIRRLRLACWDSGGDDESESNVFSDLLDACPQLEEVAIEQLGDDDVWNEIVFASLQILPALRQLAWIPVTQLVDGLHDFGEETGFEHIRDLAYHKIWDEDLPEILYGFPALERLCLIDPDWSALPIAPAFPFPDPPITHPLRSVTAAQIRASGKLTSVSAARSPRTPLHHAIPWHESEHPLEELQERIIIRSFRSSGEGDELVHLRFLSPFVENEGAEDTELDYAIWQDYTDFDGFCVPLEIITKMRQADGAKAESWIGRGIEVGAEGWKVLTDWRDQEKPEPVYVPVPANRRILVRAG